jgi:hypothetical protein
MSGALVSDLCAQLQASDDDTRIAALRCITADDLQSPAVIRQLSVAMQSPSADIRVAALKAWLHCKQAADDQVYACITDREALVRATAFRIVLQVARANRLDMCHRGLIDRSATVRLSVLLTIRQYGIEIPTGMLQSRLHDADPFVACAAAELLALRQDPVAIAWLCDRVSHGDLVFKRHAIRVIGRACVVRAVPLLINEITNRTHYTVYAIQALGMIRHPDGLNVLLVQICAQSIAVRYAAITALIQYAHPTVVTIMRQALGDNRPIVRAHAITILHAYKFIPDINEVPYFLRYGKIRHVNELLTTILQGSSADVLAKLQTLYDHKVFDYSDGYYKLISKIIKKHPESIVLIVALLKSSQLFFVRLGLMCVTEKNSNDLIMQQIVALKTHPLVTMRDAVDRGMRALAQRYPQLMIPYWSILPVLAKEQCLKQVLMHADCTVRAIALTDKAPLIWMHCVRFFYQCVTANPNYIYQLTAHEIAHMLTWQSDERIVNRMHIVDISVTWHQIHTPQV